MDVADSDTRTDPISVTYEQRDRFDVVEINDVFMQTSLLVRGVLALGVAAVFPFIKFFVPEMPGWFFLLVSLFYALRWSVDPIYWNVTRRLWLRVGMTLNAELSEMRLTKASGPTRRFTTSWDKLDSVAQRAAGILIRFKTGDLFLHQSPWHPRLRWLMGSGYIWLPTRCFVNLDAQQKAFDFALIYFRRRSGFANFLFETVRQLCRVHSWHGSWVRSA
jgi:hypothetical protein